MEAELARVEVRANCSAAVGATSWASSCDSTEAAAAISHQGRYRVVAGNLRVTEVRVDDG